MMEVTITPMGISGVFLALLGLFVVMILVGRFFRGSKAAEPEAPAMEIEPATLALADPGSEPATEDSEDKPFTLPVTPITMVPSSLISGATLALHLFDKGKLALGETRSFEVDGIPRTVTLLAAGYMNRARVDGEEVAFMLTRVAKAE